MHISGFDWFQINLIGEPFLNFNAEHLHQFDADLYRQLVAYPQEVIPTFDMSVNEMFFEKFPDTSLEHQIQVRPFNAEKTRNMRSLNPEGSMSNSQRNIQTHGLLQVIC